MRKFILFLVLVLLAPAALAAIPLEINHQGRLKILADQVQPLARLGASEYVSFGDVLVAKRPA